MSASKSSTSRLRKEYLKICSEPIPYITACPLPSNILEWHYVIQGPQNTPYEGGYYHGKLVFSPDYPFKPPAIYMITPSGRFQCNMRLCLSMSDYHPNTWNPSWSVASILTGLLSFMLESTSTTGSIETTDAQKRLFAMNSLKFNTGIDQVLGGELASENGALKMSNPTKSNSEYRKIHAKQFKELFPHLFQEIYLILEKKSLLALSENSLSTNSDGLLPDRNFSHPQNLFQRLYYSHQRFFDEAFINSITLVLFGLFLLIVFKMIETYE